MKIAITGATGFVGTRLVAHLHQAGHDLVVLSRDGDRARRVFPSSPFPRVQTVTYTPLQQGDWQGAIAGCDGVVNLAGAPIAERWTPSHKQAIQDSRIRGTEVLVAAMAAADPRPSVLVSASAIGYYGTSETACFDESSAPIEADFLSQVCQRWEAAAQDAETHGVRVVIPRFGIVLGQGGALARMLTPFRLFAGGPIGSGRQWFSWVHVEDVVRLIEKALTDAAMVGVYNATAPNPVRMGAACQALGEAMQRPSWLPVPEFVIQTLLGDGAIVVLEGQQVIPERTQASGFTYTYPTIDGAMAAVVKDMA
jgi:uncharacterized protein (TIGR01777 family)